jgi:hypothetical protein
MLPLLSFLLLALISVASAQPPILTLECQNTTDFASLMFAICSRDVLCKELYDLDVGHHNNSLILEHDFHRFQFEVTQIPFFPPSLNVSGGGGGQVPLTVYIYPSIWLPPITLDYTTNVTLEPCSEAVNVLDNNDTQVLGFVWVSLDLLKSYRQYISNARRCNDFSEYAIFSRETGRFQCVQMSGKVSNIEASSRHLLFLLAIMSAGIAAIILAGQSMIGARLLG